MKRYLLGLAALLLTSQTHAQTTSSYLPGMPAGTKMMVCSANPCTDAQAEAAAEWDGETYANGDHYYLIGNLTTGNVWATHVKVHPAIKGRPGEPGDAAWYTITNYPLPAASTYDYQGQLKASSLWGWIFGGAPKMPTFIIHKGDDGGAFDAFSLDEGFQLQLSNYLRGQPYADNVWNINQPLLVIFPDGSSAQYLYINKYASIAFLYIPHTHKDSNGNLIPDQYGANAVQRNIVMIEPNSINGANWLTLQNINAIFYTDQGVVGVVTVGPVEPGTGSGESPVEIPIDFGAD
ncbi:hypothetical protein [Silvimonas sp.]|uniref:hypothetical protein n=1 Tax=Silvimonas sp. TaxID=2650811 RepID=UPI00284C9427|nr:hypothetical protein [Silvimonas sp.]MDR3427741.1 hypothetical protein [Silvimonas sp.]